MARVQSPVANAKVVGAIKQLKPKMVPAEILANHQIPNENHLLKASLHLGQVSLPMVLVVANEVAVRALVAIVLDPIDAVTDKSFYSACG